jgi:D-alanyl-lipoteichoic acid acyltransferase DltB (MBOAT superfamily)
MAFVPIYILILGGTIIVDYIAGIWIEKTEGHKRKLFLICSLIANIGVLAVFKYYNFLNDNLSVLLNSVGYENHIPHLGILLPIGLSFHTFQAMSYTIEVYRGNQKAERHFGIYSLYVMFYPQLVAGPIERPQNLLHQFRERHDFDYERIVEGLKLMLWGLFMKLVIADRLAIYVNAVYNNPTHHSGITFIVATVFFAFQIYCDFAGYSNIAIGAARVMGFRLMTNFNRPYFSRSVAEFWKRWHISLSTWFKDYLYISLGGNRVRVSRMYLNLMIVFLVSGLWHGANWTYVIWGGLNGLYLVLAIVFDTSNKKLSRILFLDRVPRIHRYVQIVTTFVLISFSWIFFRANSVEDAFLIIRNIFHFSGTLFLDKTNLIYSFLGIFFLVLMEYFIGLQGSRLDNKKLTFYFSSWIKEVGFYVFLILIILYVGVFDGSQFIYFQF